MDISVVIVSWNVKDRLRDNLVALMASKGLSFEIIVVDNASSDKTVEMLKNDFSTVELIANTSNLGFAAACNQGLKKATGRYILLLNPDMRVFPDTLLKTLNWLDSNRQAAIAGIQLVAEDGTNVEHVRRFPGLFDQCLIASKLAHVAPFLLRHYLQKDFSYTTAARVDSIRGSFFVIRREAYETIGLLDERYFVWFEEVDYCKMAEKLGLQVWYTPVAQCVDFVGQSFKQISIITTQKYFKESMFSYFSKWQASWQLPILRFAWAIGALLVTILK